MLLDLLMKMKPFTPIPDCVQNQIRKLQKCFVNTKALSKMKAGSLSGKAVSSILLSCLEIPCWTPSKQLNPIKLFKWLCSNNLPKLSLHHSLGGRWEAGLATSFTVPGCWVMDLKSEHSLCGRPGKSPNLSEVPLPYLQNVPPTSQSFGRITSDSARENPL